VPLINQCFQCVFSQTNQVLFSKYSGDILLVSGLPFFLPCLLLYFPSIELLLSSNLSSLKSLSFYELSIPDLFVLLLLLLHYPKLLILKYQHARLFKCFPDQHVKHRLNFRVEIKKVRVLLKNLCALAVFLGWHLRLEQGNRRAV
jgi:hypothetical protein